MVGSLRLCHAVSSGLVSPAERQLLIAADPAAAQRGRERGTICITVIFPTHPSFFASQRVSLAHVSASPLSSRHFPRLCGLVYDLFLHLPICISFVDCLWFLCCPFVLVPTESACVCLYLADDMNSISGRNEPARPLPSLFRFYEQNWKKMDF